MDNPKNIQQQRVIYPKVAILGNADSGKTALMQRFIGKEFPLIYSSTVGANVERKDIEISNETQTIHIWDCGGEERFRQNNQIFYRDADVSIVCINLENPNKFNVVEKWIEEIQQNNKTAKIILVGTKKDLIQDKEKINQLEQSLQQIANDLDPINDFITDVFITSAKENEGVTEVFTKLCARIMEFRNNFPERGPVIIQVAHEKANDESKYELKEKKLNFWQRHQRKIIAGIIIGTFALTAAILSSVLPVAAIFLTSIGLTIPFTGTAATAALAGVGAAVGLLVGTLVASVTFGFAKLIRRLGQISKMNVANNPTETDSLSDSKSIESSKTDYSNLQKSQPEDMVFPGPTSANYGYGSNIGRVPPKIATQPHNTPQNNKL